MATYIKTVLPSGRGLWLEKLTTRQYRAASARVANKTSENEPPASIASRLAHEMLLASFRGVTAEVIPLQIAKDPEGNDLPGEFDVDAMLTGVPENGWIKPTFEDLITLDGNRSLDVLLDDPADYLTATHVVNNETLGGGGSNLAGKIKREFDGR